MQGFFGYFNKISSKFFTPVLFNYRSVKKKKHIVNMIPNFYFEDVYRCVEVYHHTYKTFTKKRWIDVKILDMFTKEFAAYSASYYVLSRSLLTLLMNFPRKKPFLKEELESIKSQFLLIINSSSFIAFSPP